MRPFCPNLNCDLLPSPFNEAPHSGLTLANMTMFIQHLEVCDPGPCLGFLSMAPGTTIDMQALFSIRGDMDDNVARLEFRSNGGGFCTDPDFLSQNVSVERVDEGEWVIEAAGSAALCVPILPNGPINQINTAINTPTMSFQATVKVK